MNVNLCPSCLADLPADYPYDHVETDQALTSRPDLFTRMDRVQRVDTVIAGLAKGMTLNQIALHFRWQHAHIQALLPDGHPQSTAAEKTWIEQQVRDLWGQDLSDSAIAIRIGRHPHAVCKIRARLKLPSKFGPGGRRKKTAPTSHSTASLVTASGETR
jgi:hypothetical protein